MTESHTHKVMMEDVAAEETQCVLCCNEFESTARPNRNRRVASSRFKCQHGKMFCARCDARLQFEKSRCPICRSARKRMVRLSKDVCPVRGESMDGWTQHMNFLDLDHRRKVVRLICEKDASIVDLHAKQINCSAMTVDVFESTSDLIGEIFKNYNFEIAVLPGGHP